MDLLDLAHGHVSSFGLGVEGELARRRTAPPSRGRLGARAARPPRSRPRNRPLAARSASSGSTRSLRATLTAANSTSPTSWKSASRTSSARSRRLGVLAAAATASASSPARPRRRAAGPRRRGSRSPTTRRGAGPCARAAAPGRFSGTSPKMPASRPGSSRLIASQLRSTSPAVSAAVSPKTCGWRRISFARQCSATSARSPGAALLEQQRQEVDLEEHVAELVEELRVVARVGGVGELVGLLDRVRDDRALVLLAVPGALAAQAAGQLVEAGDGGGDVGLGHPPNPRGFAAGGLSAPRRARARRRATAGRPPARAGGTPRRAPGRSAGRAARRSPRARRLAPRILVRARRDERVVDVAHRADPPGERDLLARRPAG